MFFIGDVVLGFLDKEFFELGNKNLFYLKFLERYICEKGLIKWGIFDLCFFG